METSIPRSSQLPASILGGLVWKYEIKKGTKKSAKWSEAREYNLIKLYGRGNNIFPEPSSANFYGAE